jgi:MFS family permease
VTSTPADAHDPQRHWQLVIGALGVTQILAWGSTFYLLAVLAEPIARDTGWPYDWVIGGVSVGLAVAGIVSPQVGRTIVWRGGRIVLAGSAVLIALGLALIGSAQSFIWYLGAWIIVGAGMGAGLYDAAFASLGSIYGKESRSAITAVTLYGGFASTVCWPISAYFVENLGWRGACLAYTVIHAGISLPIYLLALPRHASRSPHTGTPSTETALRLAPKERALFGVLAAVLTIASSILALVGTNLVALLQAGGLTLSAAVALGMLIGPSAVGARLVESIAGKHYHPIWTMTASVALVLLGALLLLTHFPFVALSIVFYASGNGIGSIARGTLPLALFGPARYPVLMGRLAMPIMIAMAVGPFAGAWVFQFGAQWTLLILTALASVNVVLVASLWILLLRSRSGVI